MSGFPSPYTEAMTSYLDFQADLSSPDVASAYDELTLWSAMCGLLLLRHVPLVPDARVLDVGCGTGFPLLELAQRLGPASHVWGVDPWRAALERARHKARVWGVANVTIDEGDAAELIHPDGFFSMVVSNLGINNFARPREAMRACARVLRPGGVLALATNVQGHMAELYEAFADVLRELGLSSAVPALEANAAHRATVGSLTTLLHEAGLTVTRVEEERRELRFSGGSALLHHYFIKLGFLDGWKEVVPEGDRARVFPRLEAALDARALSSGGLFLTIPLAYVEARR